MDKKKKNLLIGGLLAVVLLLAVGYAAFATTLTINGTSSIDSRWDVHIKDGGVSVKSSNMATSTRAQKDSQLTASFTCELTDPGVSTISYDIIVENTGTFGAKLSSINLTGTTDYIDATTEGIEVGDVIDPNGEDTLTVTVSYKNVTEVPTGEDATANITVTLNYIQDDGTSSGEESSFNGTGTIYSWHTGKWYQSENLSGLTPTDISTKTLGADYVIDASTLNRTYYLKYTVVNNIITESYVCFVYDSVERCLKGFDENAFSDNTSKIQAFQSAANLSTVASPSASTPGCNFSDSLSTCTGGGFLYVDAYANGQVNGYSSLENYCMSRQGYSECSGR